MKAKNRYKYDSESVKIGRSFVNTLRKHKKKTGVAMQTFIEEAIAEKLLKGKVG